MKQKQEPIIRCSWAGEEIIYQNYHDNEWGNPQHDDAILFEMLILEGMQAGLNWLTVLKKREAFQKAFDNFDIDKIVMYDDKKIEELMLDKRIIRNRLKIKSVIQNAIAFRNIQNSYGSFDKFIWKYVDNSPIMNSPRTIADIPSSTELSEKISKDMKKIGFNFVGPTIIYAYMQAIGMVNDHTIDCFKHYSNSL